MTGPEGSLQRPEILPPELRRNAVVLLGIVAVWWIVEVADLIVGHRLDQYGVRPHELAGLRGIIFAPFLHAGFGHLIGNTVPFLILGWLAMGAGVGRFVGVLVIGAVGSGLGMWLLGSSDEVHIGASGVVFALLGYLMLRGVFERRIGQIIVGLLVAMVFGGLLWGVLPTGQAVSWQGHLFGFLSGVGAAWFYAGEARRRRAVSSATSPPELG